MPNYIIATEELHDYMRRGMPDGADVVIKAVPVLFARIEELEQALIPFANAGAQDNHGKPLVYVYHKHCQNALSQLSTKDALIPK